jgi:acyl-CoA synthetase (AMP-forming)/AMP-acid ligase II
MAQRVPDPDLAGVDLSSLRGLVNCSEPVTKTSQDRFARRFAPYGLDPAAFWGCYAMAETTFALTHGTAADPGYLDPVGPSNVSFRSTALPFVSVGQPIRGVQLRIVDGRGRPCADRELGELWVRSPYDFACYHNNPEDTRLAFCDGWYKTGDLGYRVGADFFVSSRKKDLMIASGVNIYPQDIEDMVSQIEKVIPGRVAAFAEWDEALQTERPIILAESTAGEAEQRALIIRIRQEIQAALQVSLMDVQLVPPGWLIKSSAGKMARSLNREKWGNQRYKT